MLTREETDLLKAIHDHEQAFKLLDAMFVNIQSASDIRWPKSCDCLGLIPQERRAIIKRIVLAEIDRERTRVAEVLRSAVYAVEDHLKATNAVDTGYIMAKVDELQTAIQCDMATTNGVNH